MIGNSTTDTESDRSDLQNDLCLACRVIIVLVMSAGCFFHLIILIFDYQVNKRCLHHVRMKYTM